MYSDKERERQVKADWYQKNKELVKARTKRNNIIYRERNRSFIQEYKTKNPCTDCGNFFHFSAMDFDHTGNDKVKGIARLVSETISLKKILQEVEKCELVCSNCHRIRTWSRLQASLA